VLGASMARVLGVGVVQPREKEGLRLGYTWRSPLPSLYKRLDPRLAIPREERFLP
jgi:hypothetical protein